tara:strand:+ start:1096 stop:1296 length:201 start_codon:yes stop_codon:yes gene_type:complete
MNTLRKLVFIRNRHRILNDEFQKPYMVKDPYYRTKSKNEYRENLKKATKISKLGRTFSRFNKGNKN